MSEPIRGVVLAHADLAAALVRAAEGIAGVTGALTAISNEGLGPEELRARLERETARGSCIIFADLASGSCAFAGRVVARANGRVAVLTGANLPMLLDFLFHRDMRLPELVARLERKARSEVRAHVGAEAPDGGAR